MKTFPSNQPDTLRGALDCIDLLLRTEYGPELWNVLTALRGPDSRNRALKYATTCVIRKAAFPDEPTEGMSVFKTDRPEYAERRKEMFRDREDTNHFREHVSDAFTALDLFIDESNEI